MSRLDEPVDRATVLEVARLSVKVHRRRKCFECGPDGCKQLDWALAQLPPGEATGISVQAMSRPVLAFLGDFWWGFTHPGQAIRDALK